MNEFTLTRPTVMPTTTRGRRKLPIRLKLEALQPGDCLEWRGNDATLARATQTIESLYQANHAPRGSYTCRKADLGVDIYCMTR